MDYLRDAIECLFVSYDANELLKDWSNHRFDQLSHIDEVALMHSLYKKNGNQATMDQMMAVAKTISNFWIKPSENKKALVFSTRDSVFNTLLHFSQDVLTVSRNGSIQLDVESVLRWQELSSEVGEDFLVASYWASYNLMHAQEKDYLLWKPYLDIDSPNLNALFEKMMADVHNHLQGSSLNFELNWIGLMNHAPQLRRDSDFCKLRKALQRDACYAALIRSVLYEYIVTQSTIVDDSDLRRIFAHPDRDVFVSEASIMNDTVMFRVKREAYHFLQHGSDDSDTYDIVDYAINKKLIPDQPLSAEKRLYLILVGERNFLYENFRRIYIGKNDWTAGDMLFWIYLILKNRIRKELVQYAQGVGFRNFELYEKRKKLFVPKSNILYKLIDQLAVGSLVSPNPKNRYLETRIAPDCTIPISLQIRQKKQNMGIALKKDDVADWQYDFVFHFIKTKTSRRELRNPLMCRNYACRQSVEFASRAIARYAEMRSIGDKKIVGIDAANSEMNCRPEVFAQAFRMLRETKVKQYDRLLRVESEKHLGVTYHVGEDFYDIVDGLRALDEAMRFLNYKKGDRIGHGLALGTEVNVYYKKRHYTLMAPRQVLLDNYAWLLYELKKCNYSSPLLYAFLEEEFEELFRRIHPLESLPGNTTYILSWKLRGDNPYASDMGWGRNVDRWRNYLRTPGAEYAVARLNPTARRLNKIYHYDATAKEVGEQCIVQVIRKDVREEWDRGVKCVQKAMLERLRKQEIAIESNPTSNRKIGEFDEYREHPVRIWETVGIGPVDGNEESHISVSINTDDKGVFGTSLEREYALLYTALTKEGLPQDKVVKWLDNLRFNGLEQAFNYEPKAETEYAQEDGDVRLQGMFPKKEAVLSIWDKLFHILRR